jgi:hypothetical protein
LAGSGLSTLLVGAAESAAAGKLKIADCKVAHGIVPIANQSAISKFLQSQKRPPRPPW